MGENARGLFQWFALYTKSRSEQSVLSKLGRLEYEAYLPLYAARRQWSDRKKSLQLPLFTGYVFVCAHLGELPEILAVAGVVQVLPNSLSPVPVSEEDIITIKRLIGSGLTVEPEAPALGQRVLITRGPLAGIHGVVTRVKRLRLVVSIETLAGRAIAVELDARSLESAEKIR